MSDPGAAQSVPSGAIDEKIVRAIAELNVEYAIAIDEDQLERWPEFFTDPCLYRVVPRNDYELGRPGSLVYCDSKAMLIDRVSAIRRVNVFEPHRYRHVVGSTKVLSAESNRFETYTTYLVIRTKQNGPMDVFSAGSYRDEVVIEGGGAKFRKRCVVCDSEEVDTLLSLPL